MRLRQLVVAPLAILLVISGCASETSENVIARVGPNRITRAELAGFYNGLTPEKRPDLSQPGAATALLRDLINKELLELEAVRRQPELDQGQRRRLHRFADSELTNFVIHKAVNEKIEIPEERLRGVWERMDRLVNGRHILVGSEGDARLILNRLRDGAAFDQLALESMDQSSSDGGRLGWVQAGQMVAEFEEALFALEVGEVSDPVQTEFGWHILRADSIRTIERPDYETARSAIHTRLLGPLSIAAQTEFYAGLRSSANAQYNTAAMDMIDSKFAWQVPDGETADPYAMLSRPKEFPTFTAEQMAMPVVTFDDRPDYTIEDLLQDMSWTPASVWPTGGGLGEVRQKLDVIMRTKLIHDYAFANGLDRHPEYVARVKKREYEMRVSSIYFKSINADIEVTDADRRSFFKAHRANYRIAERSQLSRIETLSEMTARRLADLWKSGATFEDLAALAQREDPEAVGIELTFETPVGQEPPLDAVVRPGAIGDVVGPVYLPAGPNAGGVARPARWVVAQIISKRPERFMTFAEAESHVDRDAKTMVAEQRLKDLLSELEQAFPVEINQEAVDALTADELKTVLESE